MVIDELFVMLIRLKKLFQRVIINLISSPSVSAVKALTTPLIVTKPPQEPINLKLF